MSKKELTIKEKEAIKVLNYIATFDGIIQDEIDIIYMLNAGINKFIPKSKRNLVEIQSNRYPIKIFIKNIK